MTLGQISANDYWVTTPAGSWPLKEISVTPHDQTSVVSRIPVWAIVMAVFTFMFFLLGLLFLLARENVITGYISVTVSTTQGQAYTEQMPVYDLMGRHDIFARVNYLQSLIGQARSRG